MAANVIEMNPVSRITTGFVGVPGQRTFYLQARKGSTLVTLLMEKEQVAALAQSVLQLIEHLDQNFPAVSTAPLPRNMSLEQPLQPLFRVGQMGLGYDQEHDLLVLVAQELATHEEGEEDDLASLNDEGDDADPNGDVVRMWASRGQMEALAHHAADIVKQGRPTCPLCGLPIDAGGHFCPPRNGHKHAQLI
ncbi:MAG: DUF3090 domain-containing protein [Anaerolineae bacterium]|nr:DUF3090 domain-containing protein [Anaerolineae bacterium]